MSGTGMGLGAATVNCSTSSAFQLECSQQPLDVAFHPQRSTLLAAALVDGTVEVHDFQEIVDRDSQSSGKKKEIVDEDEDDDEVDTIISSTLVHQQILPSRAFQEGDLTSAAASRLASCRAVTFSNDGQSLYTGGMAGDLVALHTDRICTFDVHQSLSRGGVVAWQVPHASHQKSPLQVVQTLPECSPLGSHGLVTGDEAGCVRIWDTRLLGRQHQQQHQQQHQPQPQTTTTSRLNRDQRPVGCVHSWKLHQDYISAVEFHTDSCTLLATSADCRLSVYDVRMAQQLQQQQKQTSNNDVVTHCSDDQEDELLSIAIMKHGRKVVCGTANGVLAIWSWGTWGDVSDRFPGAHVAGSIDALLPLDADTAITGCSDGFIRVVRLHPNRVLGILGDHQGYPVEKLQFNANRMFVGSVSHDEHIRLFDARVLHQQECDDDDDEEKNREEHKETYVSNRGRGIYDGLSPVPPPPGLTRRQRDDDDDDSSDNHEENDDAMQQDHGHNTSHQNSDDDWDDMDEDMASDNDNSDNQQDNDSDDDDDSNNSGGNRRSHRDDRFKTDNERFFQDL